MVSRAEGLVSVNSILMRRVIVRQRGGPEVLRIEEAKASCPRRGEVRIAVRAAGVAYGDVMRRRGVLAPRGPFTPGYDVAGIVEEVGSAVTRTAVGDRVACLVPKTGLGGYQSHVCVPEKLLARIPKALDFEQAAALGLNYITAYQLLHRVAKLGAGDSLLVHGAAGGVGSAVLELAKAMGLRALGTASAGKHEWVKDLGGSPIDYRNEDVVTRVHELANGGVDVVFDGIGGKHLKESYRCLTGDGLLVAYGVSGDVDAGLWGVARGLGVYLGLKIWPSKRRSRFYAITASRASSRVQCARDYQTVMEMAARGKIRGSMGKSFPFEQVQEAHALMDSAANRGKIVLTFAEA